MHGGNVPHLALNHHPGSRMELATGGGRELRKVKLSPMKRNIVIGAGVKIQLAGAWETMP